MKYVKAYHVDAKDGRPASEYPLRHGPAWPSDALTASIVDRREYPAVIIGTLPDNAPLPAGVTEITQEEHEERVTEYEQWRADFEAQQEAELAQQIREQRDQFLTDSDWVIVYHTEKNQPVPQPWQDYRQALRDVPQQPGFPNDIDWPVSPDATE